MSRGGAILIGSSVFTVGCTVTALIASGIAQVDVMIATLVRVLVAAAAVAPLIGLGAFCVSVLSGRD